MIEININPVAFMIGSFELRWDLIATVLAFMSVGCLLFAIKARYLRFQKVYIIRLFVFISLSGFIGARLFRIVEDLLYYHET